MLPLVALIMVLVGFAGLGLGRFGEAAVSRARARTAADAAALAGAAEGKDAARVMARANGASLVDYDEDDKTARVRVRLGRAEATAKAERRDFGAGPAGSTIGLAPAMRAALSRAAGLLGAPVPITSGFRSRAQQAALFARRGSNPYPVAPPGSSMHERGLAIDVPISFVPRLKAIARQAGLCQPYPKADPVHFEVCRG